MTGASKILTVSYGTFSCTLEGFDDPFNTMKAIAEYFRDLAAEDRYFGAEPPTPDAAMLHRIAEREIHRRVEAKIQENGVILRAADEAEAPVAPVAAPRPALDAPSLAVEESVAAKLQRARRKQEKAAVEPVAVEAPVAGPVSGQDTTYSEDEHAEEVLAALSAALPPVAEDIPDQIDALLDQAEAEEEGAVEAVAAEVPTEASPLALPSEMDLSDDFADLPEAEDFAEEAPVAEKDSADAALLQSLGAELAQEPAALVADETPLPEEDFGTDDLGDDALLARLTDPLPEDVPAVEEAMEAAIEPALEVKAPVATAQDDNALIASLGAMIDPEGEAQAKPVAAAVEEPVEPEGTEPAAEPAPAANVQRARARVIRIRRAEPAPVEAAQPAPIPASALSAEAEAALAAELAALEAEVGGPAPAKVEAPGSAQPAAPQPAAVQPVRPQRARRPAPMAEAAPAPKPAEEPRRQILAEEDAVSRLMAQADSAMDGEENRRRQSAISHLKAAVAATVAERKMTGPASGNQEPRIDAYRNDLDRVVRPRRPAADEGDIPAASEQPRATPLVLVSEQRIDRPRAVPSPAPLAPAAPAAAGPRSVMPVRPRRVGGGSVVASAAAPMPALQDPDAEEDAEALIEADLAEDPENVFADAAGFEEFAERLGASQLPDLLEAAAVYCAEVLQRPEFSRPLLMRQVASVQGGVSREDCLRGFGTLLRQGRIAKVKRGMFALTDQSPYLAEARKIAG